MKPVLFVDNFDSFTYNIVHLLAVAGANPTVLLNDAADLLPDNLGFYRALVIGPGPGTPANAGKTLAMLGCAVEMRLPVFGVCLGLQAIGELFGGRVVHAPALMHGKTSQIVHDGTGIFQSVPSPLRATRYHSLCVDPNSLPAVLRVTATSEDGVIQGLAHRTLPVEGVQFHPESILSEHGNRIVANFLAGVADV
ncbi:MAG: aminodeoxychorismate/anthranilate synthase component II [Candidatus Eremiobacteraeota bacterium]|nr:aminodeoxychorismate/anthranilate synthase component II [Candidatus Eremiobacteraeota bacterium]